MTTLEILSDRLELADQLLAGRSEMLEPQDLPGRYGRVIKAIDRLLDVLQCPAVVGGGWAVWRYGYVGRITQDVDIALPANQVDEFLKCARVSGFEVLQTKPGRWPKLLHKDTGIHVDVLPEGGRPGTESRPAPTLIPHPDKMGAGGRMLKYITLPSLFELKLAAGQVRDHGDLVELIRANPDEVDLIRKHVAQAHNQYAITLDELVRIAKDQEDA